MAKKYKTRRGYQQPENENVWINNIARREEWKKRPGNVKQSTLTKYRRTVAKLNADFERQKLQFIAGLDPLERDLKMMELGLGYQITDLSRKVQTEDELQELLSRLKNHTLSVTNRRFRDNYVEMLKKAGFPQSFVNKIQKMGGKKFLNVYYYTSNVYPKMIYALYDSESDDEMYRIMQEWNDAIAKYNASK